MIRVYIVEDQEMIREMLRTLLEMEGEIEVVGAAPDAEQALVDLESIDADLVLMDVKLPGMSGVEATRRLKETRPGLPVVMLSSFEDDYVEQSIAAGAIGYVLKNSTGSELKRSIDSALIGLASIDSVLATRLFQRIRQPKPEDDELYLNHRQTEIINLISKGARHFEIAEQLAAGHVP